LLIPAIERVLQETGLCLSALHGIAVSIGPGSFTGLRVGIATALGLRLAGDLPIITVPTLEALAYNVSMRPDRLIVPMVVARPGEVYWSRYRWAEGHLQGDEEQVGGLERVGQMLTGGCLVVGEGWSKNRDRFMELLPAGRRDIVEAATEAMGASAVSVGRLGLQRLARGHTADAVVPRYVQRAEAELRSEAAKRTEAKVVGRIP
jgi:tRNA threonylcarbamoyladenosine biosynthesis protein TsaB